MIESEFMNAVLGNFTFLTSYLLRKFPLYFLIKASNIWDKITGIEEAYGVTVSPLKQSIVRTTFQLERFVDVFECILIV